MPPFSTVAESIQSPLFVAHVLAIGLCLGILAYALTNRESPGASAFALFLVGNVTWISFHTVGLLVPAESTRIVIDSLSLAALPPTATAWLVFTLSYSGRWQWQRSRPLLALVGATAAVTAFVATNSLHGLVYVDPTIELAYGVSTLADFDAQPGFWLFLLYTYGLYLLGIGVLVDLALSTNRLYRDQTIALLFAVTLPLTVATVVISDIYPMSTDLTPLSFGVAALPLAYAVFRSDLLKRVPASFRLGERKAIETLDQGVVVLDPQDRVVFANSSLTNVIGTDASNVVGAHVREVLEASPLEPASDWAADDRPGKPGGEPTDTDRDDCDVPRTLQQPATGLTYEVIESEIDDPDGPDLGRTLFFRDVTEERRRKQRLLVLNRVVRHNLRNDMNVLRGHVRLLEDQAEDESVEVIEDIASDLIRLGEKAHEMDRIIQEASEEHSPVNVAGIVDRVVARHLEDATIDVRGPEQAWVESHGPVVEAIASNLIENAVRHCNSAAPAPVLDPADETDDPPESVATKVAEALDGQRDVSAEQYMDGGRTDRSFGDGAPVETDHSDDPSVVVDVAVVGQTVTLTVADNGPGIPEQEIETLTSGEVSALQHGSGIGLWMVKWCVDLANADWEIDTDEGTRVTVQFTRPTEGAGELSEDGARDAGGVPTGRSGARDA